MKVSDRTAYPIDGLPSIVYLGIITFGCLLLIFPIPVMNHHRQKKIPIQWHFKLAKITIALAMIHGFLAIYIK